jgi:GT2 family glycosyltransferase
MADITTIPGEASGEGRPAQRLHDLLNRLETGNELDWEPMRLVPPDPWTGHIPAAFWLVKVLKPRTFVELGTHSGNSYFAFCQAMAAFAPAGRAFAVDTWQGDDHAGGYDETVFQDVQGFNTQHFRQFSTLLRSTFDEARGYFPDGEVDLLHIDGLHTYEAVRHDFEMWESALSPRAVVLFHDTNVRERNFGVWRFWRELSQRFPSFEFDHSNGLGLIAVGPEQPAALRALLAIAGDAEAASIFRGRVAARGEAFQRQIAIQNLQIQLREATEYAENLLGQIRAQVDETESLRGALGWSEALRHTQRELLAAKDQMIAYVGHIASARSAALAVRDELAMNRDRAAEQLILDVRKQTFLVHEERRVRAEMQAGYESAIADINAHRETLQQEIAEARRLGEVQARAAAEHVLQFFGNSISWKVTRPLRAISRIVFGRRVMPPLPALPAPPPPPVSEELPALPAPAEEDVTAQTAEKRAMRALLTARLQAFLAGPDKLVLPRAAQPDVSIILVLYNQAELTFGCLSAIVETLGQAPFGVEVIIADNASSDETTALLDRIEGATIQRHSANLHFLKAVNLAAKAVRGEHILLLNNDAQLLPGALASALRTLRSADTIGAVGGRIILPDGTLQEAGSIIWNDGACTGYARGEDPNGPDVMFQRDVDYCSGAFLLTPAALFARMGGFDERFAPAYYEETDYCVRLWEAGYRVVYDPDAAIVHYEFGSSTKSGDAIRLQAAHHATFVAQHKRWLSGQFAASPANLLAARTHSRAARILVIEDRIPQASLGSGYPRANRLIHDLVEAGALVTLFPTMNREPDSWHDVRRALDKRVEVLIKAQYEQVEPYLRARQEHFDGFMICRPHNMKFFLDAIGPERQLIGKARIFYDAEALFVTRDLQLREAAGAPASEAERHRLIAEEVALTRLADVVLSVSPAEQEIFEDYGAAQVRLLGHGLDDAPLETGFDERDQIVFLGATALNTPNTDAVMWFTAEILPRLRRALDRPDFRLTTIGLNKVAAITAMEGDAIEAAGMVEELAPALSRARVMVVPTRRGAGIPHKVHQAAMLGIPLVVTSLIATQLGWQDGEELLVADDPAAFADACARLYVDEALWERLRTAALARARRDCAPERFAARLREIVRDLPITHRQPAPGAWVAPPPPVTPEEPHTSRPAADDWAMAVPFGYPAVTGTPRLGVMCHLYYPAVADELLYYLRKLPLPAALMISTDTEEKRREIEAALSGWGQELTLRVVPNRGRDIAPKLIGFADMYEPFDLVLHLHSKMSDHADFLAPWRSYLFETLLGSPETVGSILDAFNRLPDLGMVAPQHFEAVRRWLGWNGNFEAAKALAGRMGIKLLPDRALDFPAGSMFWARPAALRPLLDLKLSFDDFPAEGRQLDHTLAHVIERLYFYATERSGHTWLKIADPVLCMDTTTIAEIDSPVALSRFAAQRGVLLTGTSPIAKRDEAAPLMTRKAPGLVHRLAARTL